MPGKKLGGSNKRPSSSSSAISIGRRGTQSISSSQHCPYLSALDRELPYNHPSSRNICRGQITKRRRGFKVITLGYATLTRDIQLERCIPDHLDCEHFKLKQKEPRENGPHGTPPAKKEKAPSGAVVKPAKKHEKRHHRRRPTFQSAKWHTIKQLGAISTVTLVIAFVISFFMAGGPGKFIENITFMFIQGQAQELGLTRQDLDKVRASGILRGGGMAGLKNLSRSQREKLKKSSLFRGLSAQQKSKLRKKFGR